MDGTKVVVKKNLSTDVMMTPQKPLSIIQNSKINPFQEKITPGSALQNLKKKDNCWICEGW